MSVFQRAVDELKERMDAIAPDAADDEPVVLPDPEFVLRSMMSGFVAVGEASELLSAMHTRGAMALSLVAAADTTEEACTNLAGHDLQTFLLGVLYARQVAA